MIASSYSTRSQSLKDSTLIPNTQLRIALKLIETGKQDAEELNMQRQYNSLLLKRIELRDSIINNLETLNDYNGLIIKDYITSEQLLIHQKTNLEKDVSYLEKQLKRQKRKTVFTSITSAVGISAAALLLILK